MPEVIFEERQDIPLSKIIRPKKSLSKRTYHIIIIITATCFTISILLVLYTVLAQRISITRTPSPEEARAKLPTDAQRATNK